MPDGLKPASIYLYEASVTGTETALLAAAAAPGVSEIRHAACEPHVAELCAFLQRLGVGVTGGGTSTIRIEGGAKLHGAEYRLCGDYIEAGSWAVVAAVTGGEIEVKGARPEDMEVVAAVLGAHVDRVRDRRRASSGCRAIDAAGGRADYDRTLARLPERSRQSGHGARHAGRPDRRSSTTGSTSCGCSRSSS